MIQSRHRSFFLSSLSFLLLELSFGPARDHLLLDGGQKENIENNSLGQQNVVAIVRLPFPSLSLPSIWRIVRSEKRKQHLPNDWSFIQRAACTISCVQLEKVGSSWLDS